MLKPIQFDCVMEVWEPVTILVPADANDDEIRTLYDEAVKSAVFTMEGWNENERLVEAHSELTEEECSPDAGVFPVAVRKEGKLVVSST